MTANLQIPVALKDVLLVGFGAVGAIYSLILQQSGLARVTAVARSNYDAVNMNGIHFRSRKYGNITGWRPYRLVRSVTEAADRPYSYVFVTTKAIPERLTTPRMLNPLLSASYVDMHPQPTYVLLQNGLNVEVDLYHALKELGKGEPSIISTAIWIGTNLLEPNVVEHNDFDRVTLGMYRFNDFTTERNNPAEAAVLKDIGSVLEAGGSTITIVPEIQRMKFAKNFWNLHLPALFRPPPPDPSISYAPYVSPTTADRIDTYTIPAIRDMLKELVALGRALGFPDSSSGLPSSTVEATLENTRMIHVKPNSTHKTSMLLDAERGQPIEVEVIFGDIVRMARERKVDVPRVEMMYALLLLVQNQILRKLESK